MSTPSGARGARLRRGVTALATTLGLVSAILGLGVPAVFADHYEYLAADLSRQRPLPRKQNFVNVWWAIDQYTAWWADADLEGDVAAVISAWQGAVPPLRWNQVGDPALADYQFLRDPGLCGGVPACHGVTDWDEWPVENAMYNKKGRIVVDPFTPFAPTAGRRGALAHEVGHAYGLHERYLDRPGESGCNNGEVTVMDDLRYEPGPGYYVHCDGLEAPAAVDIDRVGAYYSGRSPTWGKLTDWTATASGSVATYRWHDLAWADWKHDLDFFYWDGLNWVYLGPGDHYEEIGVHRLTEDRTHQQSRNRLDYGRPPGTYDLCGWASFRAFGEHGDWTCGPFVTLN